MKDNFSLQSDDYALYRPDYPQELIDYLISLVEDPNKCWDCGTGNGQLAVKLATIFQQVEATDISERQLANAVQKSNIRYSLQSAEKTNFTEKSFDLITVAQAAHWFDFERFNPEVNRVLKPKGIIALIGYGLVKMNSELDEIIEDFYWNVTKPFWDPERNHIEAKYQTIPFPFEELDTPSFEMSKEVSLEQLVGYIGTWSAVQHYTKANGASPMPALKSSLEQIWKYGSRRAYFPLFTRVGRNP